MDREPSDQKHASESGERFLIRSKQAGELGLGCALFRSTPFQRAQSDQKHTSDQGGRLLFRSTQIVGRAPSDQKYASEPGGRLLIREAR